MSLSSSVSSVSLSDVISVSLSAVARALTVISLCLVVDKVRQRLSEREEQPVAERVRLDDAQRQPGHQVQHAVVAEVGQRQVTARLHLTVRHGRIERSDERSDKGQIQEAHSPVR